MFLKHVRPYDSIVVYMANLIVKKPDTFVMSIVEYFIEFRPDKKFIKKRFKDPAWYTIEHVIDHQGSRLFQWFK